MTDQAQAERDEAQRKFDEEQAREEAELKQAVTDSKARLAKANRKLAKTYAQSCWALRILCPVVWIANAFCIVHRPGAWGILYLLNSIAVTGAWVNTEWLAVWNKQRTVEQELKEVRRAALNVLADSMLAPGGEMKELLVKREYLEELQEVMGLGAAR